MSFKHCVETGAANPSWWPYCELEKGAHSPLSFPLMNLGRNYASQRRGKKETAQAPPLKIVRNVRTLPKHLQGRAAHKDPEKKAGTYKKSVQSHKKYNTFKNRNER